jgi:hypothetical protein
MTSSRLVVNAPRPLDRVTILLCLLPSLVLSASACDSNRRAAGSAASPTAPQLTVGARVFCQGAADGSGINVRGRIDSIEGGEVLVSPPVGAAVWVNGATCQREAESAVPATESTEGFAAGQSVHCRVQESGGVSDVHGQVKSVYGDKLEVTVGEAPARWLYSASCQVEQATAAAPTQSPGPLSPGQAIYCRVQEGGTVVDVRGQVVTVRADQVQVAVPGAAPRWLYAFSCRAESAAPAPAAAPGAGFSVGQIVLCRKAGLPQERRGSVQLVEGEFITVAYDTGMSERVDGAYCRPAPGP